MSDGASHSLKERLKAKLHYLLWASCRWDAVSEDFAEGQSLPLREPKAADLSPSGASEARLQGSAALARFLLHNLD